MHISQEVRAALLGTNTDALPGMVLSLVAAYENAGWADVAENCRRVGIPMEDTAAYLEAIGFGHNLAEA